MPSLDGTAPAIVDGLLHSPIELRGLVLPDRIDLTLICWRGGKEVDAPPANVAFRVKPFARGRCDFNLGPFFTDEAGRLIVAREALEISAEAEIQSGIMDYYALSECFSLIEIRHLSSDEVTAAIQGRKKWGLLGSEARIWGSIENLIDRLERANNHQLAPSLLGLRDEWDGSKPEVRYDYHAGLVLG